MFIIEYYDIEFNTTNIDDLYFEEFKQAVEYLTANNYVLNEESNKLTFHNTSVMESAEIIELSKFETVDE